MYKKRRTIFLGIMAVIIGLVVLLLILFTGESFIHGDRVGIYWLQSKMPFIIIGLFVAPPVLFLAAAAIPGFIFEKVGCASIALLGVLLVVLVIAALTLLGPSVGSTLTIGSIQVDNSRYYASMIMDYHSPNEDCLEISASGSECRVGYIREYVLFRCNSLGIGCRAVQREDIGTGYFYFYSSGDIRLSTDGNELIVIVDGREEHRFALED